jgi:hypothetical protein
MLLVLPDVPLRSDAYGLEDRWLLWSRVQLYPDRLELRGWSLVGRHSRDIALGQIEEAVHEEGRLRLALEEGEEVVLRVEEAERWARFIRAQCSVREARQ